MMVYYIDTHSVDAAFNFAFEEYCMRHFTGDYKIVSVWQAENCVMLGQYQIAQNEINEAFRDTLKPRVVRRATGGGTIYTDMGTLLFSVIMPFNERADMEFTKICAPFAEALNDIGVPAVLGGRNDMLIGDRKISGSAQVIKNGCLCMHGSLMYNTDLDALTGILRADDGKIKSKAKRSMRSMVTNIADHIADPPPIGIFRDRFLNAVMAREIGETRVYVLTQADISEIMTIKNTKYDAWEWNFGSAPPFNFENEMRFPMGKLNIGLDIQSGVIKRCALRGDFLGVTDITPLEIALTGCAFDHASVEARIGGIDLWPYLRGISSEQVLKLMFG